MRAANGAMVKWYSLPFDSGLNDADGVDDTKFVNAPSSVGDRAEVREQRYQFSGIV